MEFLDEEKYKSQNEFATNCLVALKTIEETKQSIMVSSTAKKLAVFSYSWVDGATVQKLNDEIQNAGIPVEMNREDTLSSSLMSSKVDKIDEITIILVCLSESYNRNIPFFREVKSAVDRGKRIFYVSVEDKFNPNKWIGLVYRTPHFYDISGEKFESSTRKIIEALKSL